MTVEQFTTAIAIISKNHTTELIINKPINSFVGNLGKTDFTIHIKTCCASVVNNLKAENFSLSMTKNGMSIDKY